jgi:hypothetical protein
MAKFTSTNMGSINNTTSGIALTNSSDSFYFGDTTESGVWRIRSENGNLLFEKYDGSSWNEKFTMDESGEPLLSLF